MSHRSQSCQMHAPFHKGVELGELFRPSLGTLRTLRAPVSVRSLPRSWLLTLCFMDEHPSHLEEILAILLPWMRPALLSKAEGLAPPLSCCLREGTMTALSTDGNPVLHDNFLLAGLFPGGKKTCRFTTNTLWWLNLKIDLHFKLLQAPSEVTWYLFQ